MLDTPESNYFDIQVLFNQILHMQCAINTVLICTCRKKFILMIVNLKRIQSYGLLMKVHVQIIWKGRYTVKLVKVG